MTSENDRDDDTFNESDQFVNSGLATISSLVGRLMAVASLRDPNTGEFKEELLESFLAVRSGETRDISTPELDRNQLKNSLSRAHLAIYRDWLCLSLERQLSEVESYLFSQGSNLRIMLREWMRDKPYERLIPMGAMQVERDLFLKDMEAVLEILWSRTE